MTTSSELLLAILSMGSYNRGCARVLKSMDKTLFNNEGEV